ncbi:MAG: hypothetical protein ACLU80_05150 [Dorea sp.]
MHVILDGIFEGLVSGLSARYWKRYPDTGRIGVCSYRNRTCRYCPVGMDSWGGGSGVD